ncbi:MAG TPA: 3-oxoacyl-ACP synthase [Gammaproteobacteria bacterium]|nr:3-oxoacyl-ACP synthase [Gammaproteobacteria bacterium]
MDGAAQDVYLISTGTFLPGPPVGNEEMEDILGRVAGKPSRYRRRILAANGIRQRHYALDRQGRPTHLSDEMAAAAIRAALAWRHLALEDIGMLAVATSLNTDLLLPGIASLVHGRLGGRPLEILSCGGICGAGAAALQGARLAVKAGQHALAVACATERASAIMTGSRFEKESELAPQRSGTDDSFHYFNADFLRWMLSDGAGAAVLANAPVPGGLSLRIDWLDNYSFAHELDTCMYLGADTARNLRVENTWLSEPTVAAAEAKGKLLLRQDVKLLGQHIVPVVVRAAGLLRDQGKLDVAQIDHFLPHLSSYFFQHQLHEQLAAADLGIPLEKWFTNLRTKGNTGAASIYIMLDEAYREGRFQAGDKILLMIPESGRFSVSYCQLSAIAA